MINIEYADQLMYLMLAVSINTQVHHLDKTEKFLKVAQQIVHNFMDMEDLDCDTSIGYLAYWSSTLLNWIENSAVHDAPKIAEFISRITSIEKL